METIILPLSEYRLPIYEQWDKNKYPCPRNPNGWVAYHNELMLEEFFEENSENNHSKDVDLQKSI